MIDASNAFEQPIENYIKRYDNIRKFSNGRVDDYATVFLLDFKYFTETYQVIALDLSKQEALEADPKSKQ